MDGSADLLERLGITVLERGWLSSNNVLIRDGARDAVIVDTGYASHAEQTVALVSAALQKAQLTRILNTHLHSDHCGGNAALRARWASQVMVPVAAYQAAVAWDETALSFEATGQRCDRFPVHAAMSPGDVIDAGASKWEVHQAPGHDPDAVMLFEPRHRILISGDALWEHRVSVNFPELAGEAGFSAALDTLDTIERLNPRILIPGHGRVFSDTAGAVQRSRERLTSFAADPSKHQRYAVRALTVFHMLEHRHARRQDLVAWIQNTPALCAITHVKDAAWIHDLINKLVRDGILVSDGESVGIGANG